MLCPFFRQRVRNMILTGRNAKRVLPAFFKISTNYYDFVMFYLSGTQDSVYITSHHFSKCHYPSRQKLGCFLSQPMRGQPLGSVVNAEPAQQNTAGSGGSKTP